MHRWTLSFPRLVNSATAVSKREEVCREKHLLPDSDLVRDSFAKKAASLSSQFAASASYRFKFQKRSQLFVRTHNETLSVAAMSVPIQIVCPLESIAETQPRLHLALLRLSAMISKYFTVCFPSDLRAS